MSERERQTRKNSEDGGKDDEELENRGAAREPGQLAGMGWTPRGSD